MSQYSPIRKRLRSFDKSSIDLNGKSVSVLDLPIINLFHIFSFLDAHTLLTKIHQVCKYFQSIVKEDALWNSFRCLNFTNNESIKFIITVIKKCKNLKYLKITRKIGKNFDFDKKTLHSCLFDVLSHNIYLKSFSLCHFRIGLDCEDSFRAFIRNLTKLTYLDLDKCNVNNGIANIISESTNLKSLCLSRCYSVENQTFIKIFKNCKNLEHLNLSQQDSINNKVFHSLFTHCSENIQTIFLKDISIKYHNLIDIKNCSKLSVLSIDCHFLNDKALGIIKELRNLKQLELSYGILFSSEGFKKLFKEGSFLQLRHLELTCCAGLENSSLEVLSKKYKELEVLDLSECWRINDIGILHVIRECIKLQLLNLEDLKKLRGFFLKEITDLKDLKVLNLGFCDGIRIEYFVNFVRLNPNFQIKECKEYRVKPSVNLYSSPVLLISEDMFV